MITLYSTEDEMIFFHRNGQYHETLWASCHEQARDFEKKYRRKRLEYFVEWVRLFDEFAGTWVSKYPEEGD